MFNRKDNKIEREEKAKQQYEMWREMEKDHLSHWRAWGSWFSWGSPVGLGIFFVMTAVSVAIVMWAIKI